MWKFYICKFYFFCLNNLNGFLGDFSMHHPLVAITHYSSCYTQHLFYLHLLIFYYFLYFILFYF